MSAGLLLFKTVNQLISLSGRQARENTRLALTEEAEQYVSDGSPEVQVLRAIPVAGIPLAELKASR